MRSKNLLVLASVTLLATLTPACAVSSQDAASVAPAGDAKPDANGQRVATSAASKARRPPIVSGAPKMGEEIAFSALDLLFGDSLKSYLRSQTGEKVVDFIFGRSDESDAKLNEISEQLDVLQANVSSISTRVQDMQTNLAMDTAFQAKNQAFAPAVAALDGIDAVSDQKIDTSLAFYLSPTTAQPRRTAKASMSSFVSHVDSMDLQGKNQSIYNLIVGANQTPYLELYARYAGVRVRNVGQASEAFAALEGEYIKLVARQIKLAKVLVARYQFDTELNPSHDTCVNPKVACNKNTSDLADRLDQLRSNVADESAAYLRAVAALGGILSSNPALLTADEKSGESVPDASIQAGLIRGAAVAHATARAFVIPGVGVQDSNDIDHVHIAVLTRAPDVELVPGSDVEVAPVQVTGTLSYPTGEDASDWSSPIDIAPTATAPRTQTLGTSQTGMYGYFKKQDDGMHLAVGNQWRIVDIDIPIYIDPSKRYTSQTKPDHDDLLKLQVTVGHGASAVTRNLTLDPATFPNGQFGVALNLATSGSSSLLANLPFASTINQAGVTGSTHTGAADIVAGQVVHARTTTSNLSNGSGADQWLTADITVDPGFSNTTTWATYRDARTVHGFMGAGCPSPEALTYSARLYFENGFDLIGKARNDFEDAGVCDGQWYNASISNNDQVFRLKAHDEANLSAGKTRLGLQAGWNALSKGTSPDVNTVTVDTQAKRFGVYMVGNGT